MPDPPKKAELRARKKLPCRSRSTEAGPVEPPKPEPPPEELNDPGEDDGRGRDSRWPGASDLGANRLDRKAQARRRRRTAPATGTGPGAGSRLGPWRRLRRRHRRRGISARAAGITLPRGRRGSEAGIYTADAMRAKVQGSVWLECIVMPDGERRRGQGVRSLDPVFGLDQEAIKGRELWRFRARHAARRTRARHHHDRADLHASLSSRPEASQPARVERPSRTDRRLRCAQ